ncbi:MAG TPA: Gfo/Idh/MocA family oxidoreductase [Gemmataceae bacterium]
MSKRPDRREFLAAGSAALAAGLTLAQPKPSSSPNERLHVGVIGVANRGEANWLGVAAAGAEIVAICDVDERRTGKIRERFPKAKFFADYRRMIDAKGLDAVVVSTPDHTHAIPTSLALKAGLHVYCEKPLTHDVYEARQVAETAAKAKRVTQMGTQIHAGDNYRRVVELIQSGAIGPVHEVHAWCGRSWGGAEKPKDRPPVPEGLHWDLWLGPAPQRPYHPAYVPFNWRGWWDFGGGTLADMACHYTDLPFWALKLSRPTRVEAKGPPPDPQTAAVWLIVEYDYPARDNLPPVKLTWYDGGKRPELFAQGKLPRWGDGVLFVGEKGMLIADYNRHRLLPEKQFEGFQRPEPFIPASIGHHREWVEACKTGGPTTCSFDYSGPLTEAALLGVVSYRCGKPLEWDAENLRAKNAPEADAYIRREYRKGWSL